MHVLTPKSAISCYARHDAYSCGCICGVVFCNCCDFFQKMSPLSALSFKFSCRNRRTKSGRIDRSVICYYIVLQNLAGRKEQSALRAVIKCIEDYNLEAEFPPENLKKRLEQLDKVKPEKKRPVAAPANKRTRANHGGPMPPAKAGRLANAYVSSFPSPPTFVRSPSHAQYPAGFSPYHSPPTMYGSRSPQTNPYGSPQTNPYGSPQTNPYASPPANHYAYSPEAASPYPYSPEAAPPPLAGPYPGAPMNYPVYGAYGNGMAPAYQQAYYR